MENWSNNYNSWKIFKKHHKYLLIKYEDLIQKPDKIFLEILEFIHKLQNKSKIIINENKFKNTIKSTSFSNLQKLEKKKVFQKLTKIKIQKKLFLSLVWAPKEIGPNH